MPPARYTQKELETFVTVWQTSSTVAEAVYRLQGHKDFRDTYFSQGHWESVSTWEPLSVEWARSRSFALRKRGVPLRRLPSFTNSQTGGIDYDSLKILAGGVR